MHDGSQGCMTAHLMFCAAAQLAEEQAQRQAASEAAEERAQALEQRLASHAQASTAQQQPAGDPPAMAAPGHHLDLQITTRSIFTSRFQPVCTADECSTCSNDCAALPSPGHRNLGRLQNLSPAMSVSRQQVCGDGVYDFGIADLHPRRIFCCSWCCNSVRMFDNAQLTANTAGMLCW